MELKRSIVSLLNKACTCVDEVAYRPAVVRLTLPLPRWWSCQLAKLSMRLDDRWGTRYWAGDAAPAAPQGTCEACGRRAAWLVVGGPHEDDEEPGEYFLASRPIYLCGWCRLETEHPMDNEGDVRRALAAARARSIAWRWRWSAAR
ncbi:MAG TPA: hypothetical protein VIM33_00460 [Gaiellaceae bacterium]